MEKTMTNAAGWVLLIFGAIALSSLSVELLAQLQQSPIELWGIVWVTIIGIVILMLVGLLFDLTKIRKEAGQFRMWVVAFIFGALIAPWISLKGNHSFDDGLIALLSPSTYWSWNAAITAPLVEETAKAAVIVGIFAIFRERITRPLQALFVGVAVGFGFQFTENVFYGFSGAFENIDGDFIGGAQISLLRLFTGLFSHWNYAAFTAVGIGLLYGITYQQRTKK